MSIDKTFICFRSICLLFVVCTANAATPASVLESLAVPDNATLQIVTDNALHNGVPIAIAKLESPEPVESVAEYYRQLWSAPQDNNLPGFIESSLQGQLLISRLRNDLNVVLQLETKGDEGTSGSVSVMAVKSPQKEEKHEVFSDLRILSSHRFVDGVDTSKLRVYASPTSVSQTHDIYRQRLMSEGWQVLSDTDTDTAWVTQLGRDNARLEISFVPSSDFGSVIVAHKLRSD